MELEEEAKPLTTFTMGPFGFWECDIIVFSQTPGKHVHRLKAVFNKLRAAGLKLKPYKCDLFKKEIKYLGHVFSQEGVSTDPDKIKSVTEWP